MSSPIPTRFQFNIDHHPTPEQSLHWPGDTLSGSVKIIVDKVRDGVSDLTLRFMIKEDTNVCFREYHNRPHNTHNMASTNGQQWVREQGEHVLVQIDLPIPNKSQIIQQGQKIQPGTYSIPFSFQLPTNLPSITSTRISHDHSHATTFVGLRATIHRLSDVVGDVKLKIASTDIQRPMHEAAAAARFQPKAFPQKKGTKGWELFGSSRIDGEIFVGAQIVHTTTTNRNIPQGCCCLERDVSVCIPIVNDSRATIKSIVIQLVQSIKIKGKHHHVTKETVLMNGKWDPNLPGDDTKRGHVTPPTLQTKKLQQIEQQLLNNNNNNNQSIYTLSGWMTDKSSSGIGEGDVSCCSYEGGKITVSHSLKIQLQSTTKYPDIQIF